MPKEQEIKWSKLSSDIYERFAAELGEGLHDGTDVTSGNQDVRYGIELQQKRLKDKGLTMSYDFIPRGQFSQSSSGSAEWKDEHYKSRTYWKTCQLKLL